MTLLCPLPPESPFWFPTAPGVTTLPVAPEIVENEYPEPPNSIPVDDDFDPQNPPCDLWDELPDDTPEVPAATQEIEVIVPVATIITNKVAVVRTTVDAERGVVSIPQQEDVDLVVRTRIIASRLDGENITITTRTKISVIAFPPAIREDPVECVCVIDFTVSRSTIAG
jgi:hypothetical protein